TPSTASRPSRASVAVRTARSPGRCCSTERVALQSERRALDPARRSLESSLLANQVAKAIDGGAGLPGQHVALAADLVFDGQRLLVVLQRVLVLLALLVDQPEVEVAGRGHDVVGPEQRFAGRQRLLGELRRLLVLLELEVRHGHGVEGLGGLEVLLAERELA